MHRVVDAVLALLDLDLGRAADADDGNAARQLRQALLQFLLVVIRGRLLDLRAQLRAAGRDVRLLAGAVDDRRVLLVDAHLLGPAEHVERDVFELDAEILADHLAAGQDGKVLEHRFAAIAEARRLDRRDLEPAAQLVDDQASPAPRPRSPRPRSAADCRSAPPLRAAAGSPGEPDSFFSNRRMCGFSSSQIIFCGIGHEIRREIAAVELHALDDVELGFEACRLLDRDDALVADLVHRLRDHLADLAIVVGRDRADLGDLGIGRNLFRDLLDVIDDRARPPCRCRAADPSGSCRRPPP